MFYQSVTKEALQTAKYYIIVLLLDIDKFARYKQHGLFI